jgi:amino acid transporter
MARSGLLPPLLKHTYGSHKTPVVAMLVVTAVGYVCMYVCVCVCMYVYVCMYSVYVCMYVCVCVCMYVCVYV